MRIIFNALVFIFLQLVFSETTFGLPEIVSGDSVILNRYEKAFRKIEYLLKTNGSFKLSVFEAEETYYKDSLSETDFTRTVSILSQFAISLKLTKHQFFYKETDSTNFITNFSLFSLLRDNVYIVSDSAIFEHRPFKYDSNDPSGRNNWSNMFVIKLLKTHMGNCHSLSYMYKILADELGAKCWLALAPNHVYIRNYSKKIGWYNTELTSGVFPTDAWIAMTGYVSTDAIRSGVYMDTLSNQQSIGLCVLDLAKGYEFQTHNYYDGFIVKCCDLVLKYHSVNPQALLLKAETLQKVYFKQQMDNKSDATATYAEMEKAYIALAKLGYREMPEKMYIQWLQSLTNERKKYANKSLQEIIPGNK